MPPEDSVVGWNSYKASLSQGDGVPRIETASSPEITETCCGSDRRVGEARSAVSEVTTKQLKAGNKGNFPECVTLFDTRRQFRQNDP